MTLLLLPFLLYIIFFNVQDFMSVSVQYSFYIFFYNETSHIFTFEMMHTVHLFWGFYLINLYLLCVHVCLRLRWAAIGVLWLAGLKSLFLSDWENNPRNLNLSWQKPASLSLGVSEKDMTRTWIFFMSNWAQQ